MLRRRARPDCRSALRVRSSSIQLTILPASVDSLPKQVPATRCALRCGRSIPFTSLKSVTKAPGRTCRTGSTASKASLSSEGLQFLERARPVFAQQARQSAIGQQLSAGLAARAIVRLIVGIADALDLRAAAQAWLLVSAVHGHAFAKRCYFLGEFALCILAKPFDPPNQRQPDRLEEAANLLGGELLRELDRRKSRLKENLVGVGVADAAEQSRIGARALQCVVGGRQRLAELMEIGVEHFQSARSQRIQPCIAGYDIQRRASFRSRFRQQQTAVREIEGRKTARPRHFDTTGAPVQPPGDHEVQHQPQIVFESDGYPLADSAQLADLPPFHALKRRIHAAKQERTRQANMLERLRENALLERFDIDDDVGQLRHSNTA